MIGMSGDHVRHNVEEETRQDQEDEGRPGVLPEVCLGAHQHFPWQLWRARLIYQIVKVRTSAVRNGQYFKNVKDVTPEQRLNEVDLQAKENAARCASPRERKDNESSQ